MDIKIAQQMTITELVLENQKLKQERDQLRRMSVVELMGENLNVKHHVTEWENRCIKAERERDEARVEQCSIQCAFEESQDKIEKLERERDEWAAMCGRYKQERDTLIQKLDSWQEIAEHLHYFVQHSAYGVDQAIRRMDVLEAYKHLKK
jgi:hypothetical protein